MKVFLGLFFCIAICEANLKVPQILLLPAEERCSTPIAKDKECAREYKGFTFNIKTKKCEPFTTKLCRLPLNSFNTLEECEQRCMK
ncbi:Kunitz/Bovine pancreatic trypsin inhibitor domain protein [Ancylostoma caninum]|uniref:Kunitz/Bovine pancreatic trypsin inhibitor domain protein n=1 Tax=Ancylostoma caninum TaxID=29170 RepID=A0A368FYX4_ANCCA|nr:Kunitz/Bovine pancreatic trypsin inhibitor domain protein [Ancylostoma caninum]